MMMCEFCNEPIHFWDEFYVIKGHYFHVQTITPDAVRCKRVISQTLLKEERKLLKGKGG